MSELRFHPFLRQWVITATHRQDRTFLPPEDYCPLCPTAPGGFPTEIPFSDYDIVVFENKFPSLFSPPTKPVLAGTQTCPVLPSAGVCEVICYSSNHSGSFATLPLRQVRKLVRVWSDRTRRLAIHDDVEYVFIFENKGKEIGVTLDHPHGQIYGYSFVPPVAETEIAAERDHWDLTGEPLMAAVLREERESGDRIVFENASCVVLLPSFARYPYELYVVPTHHRPLLTDLRDAEADDFAEAMHTAARGLDAIFGFSMPYVMAIHQAPTKIAHRGGWLHAEFYPAYRTETKLKYLAGSEAGAGVFINDTLAEVSAERLRLAIAALSRSR